MRTCASALELLPGRYATAFPCSVWREMWESVLLDSGAAPAGLVSREERACRPSGGAFSSLSDACGGGAERVAVTLLNHLDRSKFDLSLAVLDTRGAVFLDQLPPDVTFLDLRASRVRYALAKIVRVIRQAQPHAVFSTLGHLKPCPFHPPPVPPASNGIRGKRNSDCVRVVEDRESGQALGPGIQKVLCTLRQGHMPVFIHAR